MAALPKDWREELQIVDEIMRAVSMESDPNEMVRVYGDGIDRLFPSDEWLSVSRRGLEPPYYRITRSSRFVEDLDPWKNKDRLPVMKGGLLGELSFSNKPHVIDDLRVDESDPAYFYLSGIQSLICLPQYDTGEALNIVFMLYPKGGTFDRRKLPMMLWQANLFGRATLNLVLRRQLAEAYAAVDRELKVVGDIQRSLLPGELPDIPGVDLAADYQTAQRAGGDYYDLFPLPDGEWGVFIADVSGHGTPAAVTMAITHAIAHTHPGPPMPPSDVFRRLNQLLARRYSHDGSTFVTAFYAVFDPEGRRLKYASAGHNPPRLRRRDGTIVGLDKAAGLPLGIVAEETYVDEQIELSPGDLVFLYTDGVVEMMNPRHELFGLERLDQVLRRGCPSAREVIDRVGAALAEFSEGETAADDRTMLAIRVQ